MLKDKIGYQFRNNVLFRKALTHSSYANEQRARHLQNNERLEFLGDSVLGFVTADYLYNHFPELPEGELTKLRAAVVCEQALYEVAKELGIDKEICLGHGEETGRRPTEAEYPGRRGRGAAGRNLSRWRHRACAGVCAELYSAKGRAGASGAHV